MSVEEESKKQNGTNTVVDQDDLKLEAHWEKDDPFHRYVPSADDQDDLEDDEDTLFRRCEERISRVVHFFYDKAKEVDWDSVKARTAWMNFAFLQPLRKVETS